MNQNFKKDYHDEKEQVDKCIEWLKLQTITKGINKKHTSYGYKHMVENWCHLYISNNSFKKAVEILDIYNIPNDNKGLNILIPIHEGKLQKMLQTGYESI